MAAPQIGANDNAAILLNYEPTVRAQDRLNDLAPAALLPADNFHPGQMMPESVYGVFMADDSEVEYSELNSESAAEVDDLLQITRRFDGMSVAESPLEVSPAAIPPRNLLKRTSTEAGNNYEAPTKKTKILPQRVQGNKARLRKRPEAAVTPSRVFLAPLAGPLPPQ
ncbi:hypothetical protein PHLCEN_2v12622 [Hermanssonia centrifuga]|uniref:Uncharacterized protein n=1 Tax=Hermanssonia centrifuga TaxID=98765 RepID=A0A2R6NGQ2_9APHY|nr:hypothetical protein PHLCEN_2v12622 [Hermanssonia centrifuga]